VEAAVIQTGRGNSQRANPSSARHRRGRDVAGNIDALLVNWAGRIRSQLLARIGSANLDSDREAATQALERSQDSNHGESRVAVNSMRLEASRSRCGHAARAGATRPRAGVLERQTTLHKAGATPAIVYEKAVKDYEAAVNHELELWISAARFADNASAASAKASELKNAVAQKSARWRTREGQYTATEIPCAAGWSGDDRKARPATCGDYGDQFIPDRHRPFTRSK